MATGAADGIFRSLYEGCLSGTDICVKHRPYHRNCGCALHDRSQWECPHAFLKRMSVSYPKRRSWSEGLLAMTIAAATAVTVTSDWGGKCQLGPSKGEEEEEDGGVGNGEVWK